MTNASVIELLKKGMGEAIIKAKIKQSTCNFDLSTNGMITLKDNKASDGLILAMIEKQDEQTENNKKAVRKIDQTKAIAPKYQAEVDLVLPNLYESGIFIYDPVDKIYNKLDATVITGNKSGGFGQMLAMGLTYGLANSKTQASLYGAKANLQIKNNNPVFYFFFDYQKSSINNSNNSVPSGDNYFNAISGFMTKASNPDNAVALTPNDFKLLDLKESKDKRTFVATSGNLYSQKGGVSTKQIENFKYERLTPTLYKVSFVEPLDEGEYCFYYAGNSSMQSSGYNFYQTNDMKVFDFGIKK